MCDCFHLAFPNWHASAAGEGRRLKEPEQDTDDDLVCEEPEVLEGERPRPQGSSPVEEFPTTEKYAKQVEGDFYDSPTKSSKKSKRIGFGSLFDKRSSAKMNQTEDMQIDQSEIIVKTVKEVCAEGLVVSGGKDGIFIKEVEPESPASKHLSVKEGDQILSATVYFDNVSYEDALQILEHAQPYKVAFCLKRKPAPRTQEDAETERPDITIGEEAEQVEEGSGPEMRGRRKTKKQHDRISWPKFPTFSKGRRANFKRSHSTSEAEEQRKLEISPPTSDTESPLKSPLKSPDGKDKKKKHKVKPKKRMAGHRSKSVEETQENEEVLATDNMKVLDNQIIMNIVEEQVPMTNVIESPKILNEAENIDSTKTGNEYTFPTLPATESLHKVELISVYTTLKTTDITVALGDDGKERREKSELRVSIPGKDKYEIETESQLKSSTSGMRTLDPSTFYNILDSPNVISQTEPVGHRVDSNSKPINKEILEKTQESGKTDMTIAKVDVSLDMPEVGPISKSPRIGSDKEKKERKILETESYGIRTRGPLADIATSKSHFSNAVNKLDFTSDTFTCEIQKREDMPSTDTKKPITPTPVISQPKSHALDVDRSRKSTGGSTDIESNFKLPKVDVSEFDHQESITVRQKDPTKVPLLKREEIEISGMEDIGSKAKVKPPRIKEQKVEKIIKISKAGKKQAQAEAEEFNVKDVKDAVSKFPAFKLPERDITGVLVQREITIMEIKSDKTGMTPKGSPCKISSMSTEININLPDTMDKEKQRLSPVATKGQTFVLPKIEQLHLDEMVIIKSKTDLSKMKLADHQPKTGKMLARDDKISTSPDVKFKLPKREDIEIPGIEAIEQSVQPTKIIIAKDTDTQDEAVKDYTDTNIKADKNVHEKKSNKSKVSMPSFGIMTPDIRFPGIVIELPIKATSPKSDSGTIKERTTEAKISEDNIKQSSEEATFKKSQKGESCAPEHETKKAHDIEDDQILHFDVCTAIVKETSKQDAEGELKAEIKSKGTDSSPQKKKLHKLKMPKIGGKSMKGTAEVITKEDVTVQENDIIEVVLDSEKRTFETDPKAYSVETKLKMPSIDVSVPKIKIPKAEGKSKQEETGLSKPEAVEAIEDAQEESGFRLIKFGISMPKEKTEEGDLLPDESEKSIIKVSGKTEVEPPELPQAEMKVAESKMKKRKISFPKFGFSKSDTKVSDADITLPAAQGSLHDADWTELDVESKTKDVEAEFKDSTDYLTKFKLPTIKFPKFGVSFPKPTDAGGDIQMPDVSTDEAKLPVEATALSDKKGMEMTLSVSKPEVDLSLPEGKAEIKGFQKKEIKSSEEMSFSKPDIDASLTGHDAEEIPAIAFSKQDIKAAGIDVSLPQVDLSIPEVSVEIKEPGVHFTISKDEAEHKDLTNGGTPVKFPSISLPKFGGKSSKVVKDMPFVDIDTEEPDESLPETQISMQLKDDAPTGDIKDSFETTEGQFVSVDMKVEETTLKEQEVTVTLPKFGISLPKVKALKPTDSVDKEKSTIDPRESNADSDQAEKDPRSPTKIKRPTIKFPKVGVSFPKSTDAVSDNQMPEVTKDEPAMEIKALETELPTELPSLPEMKTPHIILSVSKPEVDVSTPEVEKAIDEHSEKKKEKVLSSDYAFSKPEVKMSLVGHGLDQETAIEGLKVQASNLEAEVILPSGSVDEVILEAKEKESEFKLKKRKIPFPKFGFYKSDTKIPDADTSLQKEGISVPDTVIKETEMTFPAPEVEVQLKNKSTSGSPSKFKLPTISLPKFDISISKTGEESVAKSEDDAQSEIKAASQDKDTGTQDTEPSKSTLETLPVDAEIKTKDTDPSSQGSRFMMPKFEFSFQKLKGPEFKKGASRTDAEKSEVPLKHDKESAEGKADIPEASVEMEVTLKMPKMPSSDHEFSEQDIKAPEINVERGDTSMAVGEVDVNLESDLKIQTTEMLKDDSTMGGSQIKFKLPTFKLPKFRSSSSKVKAEIMDLRGEEITLETEDLITSVEPSDVKIDSNVPGQELKKPSISADQTKVDSGDQYTLSLTEARISKAEGYISLPEAKLGEVSQATLESKIDQEVGLKDTGMKMKKTGFSLPKFGFSKPDIKAPEIDVSLAQVDTSKPESDLKIKEQILNITVSNVEDDQKDTTALGATAKFQLPSINIPKIGGQATKEEKTMPVVDIAVKGPEVTGPDTQIKISGEAPSVDIKRPHLATEGQSVSVDLNVEDAELGGQGGKFKMPKFGIGLPKVKGFDLSTSKTDDITEVKQIHITKPEITTEGMVQPPEQDSKFLDVQIKPSPEFGFSKPEVKAPEVDVSIQKTDIPIPEGSMDLEEANVDIKVSKMESDQKGSTIFGSPTKFKLPSISLPKFGVKSQKVALDINVADSELEGTNIKTDISKPDVKLEVQTPKSEAKVEGSADMPEVDSKGLQVKVKRSSFSFPKFGFSKPDTATPEVNISVPKAEVSIPEVNVPVKEQTAEVTLPGGEAEQKDLMIVSSPTEFKLPEVNLPKFGVKTSKGTVSLPSADKDIKGIGITVHEPDIKLSGQIQKTELDVKEIETDIHATIREIDVHLAEGKVILPQPDVDVQDISIEGKADMSEVDLKGHDVKLKKPSFSLPKFGFSKTDIKGQDVDAIQPKADMSMQEGNIPVEDKDAEITITDEVKKQGDTTTQTKFKLPSINLPKFGLKYPKATADIPAAEVDIKEPEISFPEKGEVQTTDTETNIDIKGPSADVDIKVKEIDDDGTGSKFKLPKFVIGMPKVKEIEIEGKEINIETGLLCKENVNVQQPGVEIQNVTIEGKTDKDEVDSKGLKVKLPKLGFSKPDLKAPEVDVSLPKADMGTSVGNVDVSKQSADIKLPEQDLYLKEDTFGSPTRFKLPTISFPKFGTKASKDTVDIPTAHVDIKVPEVSLPNKKFNMSGEVSSVEMKGPTVEDPSVEINIKGDDKKQQEGKFKLPKFGIALPTIKGPDSDQGLKKALTETKVKMSGDALSINKKELILPKGSVEVDVEAKGAELEVEESKIKLPQFGISLQASKSPEIDISVSKAEVSKTDIKKAGTEKDVEVEEPAGLTDLSSKGLKMKKPSFGFPNIVFSKSDGKSQDIQATETTADISLPGGNTEIEESEREGKTEITGPQFGSPTKFKLPTIKLPKFGLSAPKVPSDAAKADSETKEIKVSSVDYEIETSKLDPSGDIKGKTAETETASIDINIKEKELNQEGQEIKFKLPKFGISLPKVKGPEVTVTAKEVKTETPEIGFTEPEIKMQAEDASLPKVDMALEESSSLEKKEVETELKEDTVVSGSPSKFKLPTFKMPKFGISTQKTSDAKVKVAEVDVPDANTDLNIEDKPVQMSKEIQREGEIKETTEQLPDTAAKKLDGDKGSPSKFKFPTIKMPKISISRTKSQEGEDDTTTKASAPDAKTETKDDTQGPGKSPKFTMPTLEDVLRGFEVEFNVPTTEEMEAQKDTPSVKQDQEAEAKVEETAEYKDKGAQEKSKFKFKFPKLGFSQSSDESDTLVDAKIEESEKHLEASADQKATVSKEQAKTEKGGWFKFLFSSPTKTSKTDGKEIIQPPEEAEKLDDVEKESSKAHEEPEKISLSEAVEENISPTPSLKSSDAFADISSTVTTEQTGLSQTSPTKVKVKYAEPTATVGVSDVQNDVVTSTARCELISVEPHQPEKVNIPFLLDMSSASVDTLKQMSGEIHVITSNIQAIPETQQASILTNLDVHGIHTSPLQVTLGSDSVLTVEETRVQSGTHTLVERHVVKETLHDDKETILVTQRTRVFEGDSAEPISDETASSIRRLRDTVHTEKMSFLDSAATIEEVTIVSSETSLRHMDSSTDENGGK
ncbi:neuroblast differentiation-associated protein AHNAK-like [Sinocyclocheilus anshuiensis]|uniref:neuroblast differentiation-associated protein AHNAK-like n=1 Tax=Sinocyclocheilus anshuiensis TaxID=1608454 RepID=UPI0007B9EE97|nr:PREDICTED: neuroblast differentiation-associated protein AHNAK-like [Sinocyclocheilus anshuiensis]